MHKESPSAKAIGVLVLSSCGSCYSKKERGSCGSKNEKRRGNLECMGACLLPGARPRSYFAFFKRWRNILLLAEECRVPVLRGGGGFTYGQIPVVCLRVWFEKAQS